MSASAAVKAEGGSEVLSKSGEAFSSRSNGMDGKEEACIDLPGTAFPVEKASLAHQSLLDGIEGGREKLPLVRVKRKLGVGPVDSLWLEVSTRPSKRRELENSLLQLQGLQLGDSTTKLPGLIPNGRGEEEGATRKLFRRLDTVTPASLSNIDTSEQLFRLIEANKKSSREGKVDRRPDVHKERQEKLLTKARDEHMAAARSARFEQVQRSRRAGRSEGGTENDAMAGLFQLYDVIRVDKDEAAEARRAERRDKAKRDREAAAAEGKLLCNYMPLLLEYVPQAASDVERHLESSKKALDGKKEEEESGDAASGQYPPLPDVRDVLRPAGGPRLGALPLRIEGGKVGGGPGGGIRVESKPRPPLLLLEYKPLTATETVPRPLCDKAGGDGSASGESDEECVYDLYCMEEDAMPREDDSQAGTVPHPVVRVVEEEYEEAEDDITEYDSEDSNAENNPRNDYPDEEDEDEDWYDYEGQSMVRDEDHVGSVSNVYNDDSEEYDTMIDEEEYDERRSIGASSR